MYVPTACGELISRLYLQYSQCTLQSGIRTRETVQVASQSTGAYPVTTGGGGSSVGKAEPPCLTIKRYPRATGRRR